MTNENNNNTNDISTHKKKNLKSLTDEEKEALFLNEIGYFTTEYEKISQNRSKDKQGNHLTAHHVDMGYAAEYEALLIMADIRKNYLIHVVNMPPYMLQQIESDAKKHALELFKKTSRVGLNAFHNNKNKNKKHTRVVKSEEK